MFHAISIASLLAISSQMYDSYAVTAGDYNGDGRIDQAGIERDYDSVYLVVYLDGAASSDPLILENLTSGDLNGASVQNAAPGLYRADCTIGYFDSDDDEACFKEGVMLQTAGIILSRPDKPRFLYYWHEDEFLKMPLLDQPSSL